LQICKIWFDSTLKKFEPIFSTGLVGEIPPFRPPLTRTQVKKNTNKAPQKQCYFYAFKRLKNDNLSFTLAGNPSQRENEQRDFPRGKK
jgi:hypothetical protein